MLSILAEARCKKVSSYDAAGTAVSWNWSRGTAGKPKSARPSQAARLTSSNDYRYGNLPRFGVSWPLIENAWSAAGSTFGSHHARDVGRWMCWQSTVAGLSNANGWPKRP